MTATPTPTGEFTLLRIVMVCSSTNWGGTEKWALRAAEELAYRGHAVTFVARRPKAFAARRNDLVECRANLTITQLPLRNDADLVSLFRLANLLDRERADVLIPTRVRDYWLGGLAAKLAGVPELLRLGVQRTPRDRYWRDRLRYGHWPAGILVNAHAIKREVTKSRFVDPEQVHVIYNGVETPGPLPAHDRTALRAELGVGEGELLIVGAGRLATEKRWDWWLEAVHACHEQMRASGGGDLPPVRGVLLGDGAERPALETRRTELGLDDIVSMPGHRNDAARVLGAADIVVMTSLREGISNTLLEALGQGIAVASTAAGGAAEVLADNRDLLLVDPDDKAGLIDAVVRLASDSELRNTLGRDGLATVQREFSWQRSGDELVALLRRVAGKEA